jgi:hypothetical protein
VLRFDEVGTESGGTMAYLFVPQSVEKVWILWFALLNAVGVIALSSAT